MDFKELVAQNRSRRRFDQSQPIDHDLLLDLIDTVRLIPSAKNLQPLKYAVTSEPIQCARLFPHLGWAGYLKDWKGPADGERPTGYIVILLDKNLTDDSGCDHGIACQTLMLAAVEKGLGGCILGNINREKIAEILELTEQFEILLVLALGVPAEEVLIECLSNNGEIRYWRDAEDRHHVPKRSLDELIVTNS